MNKSKEQVRADTLTAQIVFENEMKQIADNPHHPDNFFAKNHLAISNLESVKTLKKSREADNRIIDNLYETVREGRIEKAELKEKIKEAINLLKRKYESKPMT
jgi:hypothetical protein